MLQEQLELENACALTNALEIKDGAFEEPLNATTSLSRDSSTEVQRRIPPPWSHRATALSHKDACFPTRRSRLRASTSRTCTTFPSQFAVPQVLASWSTSFHFWCDLALCPEPRNRAGSQLRTAISRHDSHDNHHDHDHDRPHHDHSLERRHERPRPRPPTTTRRRRHLFFPPGAHAD